MNKQIKQGLFVLVAGVIMASASTTAVAADVVDPEFIIVEGETIFPSAGAETILEPNYRSIELQLQITQLEKQNNDLINENEILAEENEQLKEF